MVSILIVARNTGALIGEAIGSARAQTLSNIEIVVVDDRSTDDTRLRAQEHAAQDPRVRVLAGPDAGLAAARNASLAAARGRYAAILDSDDLLHPRHLEWLVAAAERTGAGLVAANMVRFRSDPRGRRPSLFAEGAEWAQEREITLERFVLCNRLDSAPPPTLGYLKPLIGLSRLRAAGIGYDTRLRIGEDYDLMVRAMAAGSKLVMLPQPTYFYRQHDRSTSYRIAREDLVALISAADAGGANALPPVRAALLARRRTLENALAHTDAVTALKARRPIAALRALDSMAAARLMVASIREGMVRRLSRRRGGTPAADMRPAHALLIGDPPRDGPVRRLADALAQRGWIVDERPSPPLAEAHRLAELPAPAMILLGDAAAHDAVPFLLAPDVPRVAAEGAVLTLRDGSTGAAMRTWSIEDVRGPAEDVIRRMAA